MFLVETGESQATPQTQSTHSGWLCSGCCARRRNPKNLRLTFLLGVLCEHTNDLSGAAAYYQQVVDTAPEFTAALNNLAFLIAEGGGSGKEMDQALTLALKAAERHGDQPQIIDTLGWVYFRRGEYDKAYAQFQKLADKGADNPILNYHLGMVLYKQGRRVEARKLLEKALAKPAKYVDKKVIEEALKELG